MDRDLRMSANTRCRAEHEDQRTGEKSWKAAHQIPFTWVSGGDGAGRGEDTGRGENVVCTLNRAPRGWNIRPVETTTTLWSTSGSTLEKDAQSE